MTSHGDFEYEALKYANKLEHKANEEKRKKECTEILNRGLAQLAQHNIERARNNQELLEALEQQNKYVLGI